jgi:hypothetical protein
MHTVAFAVDLRRHVGREEIVRIVLEQHRWSPAAGDPYDYLSDCLSDAADHAQLYTMTLVRALEALPLVVLRRWVRAVVGRAGGDREGLVYSLVAAYAVVREPESDGATRSCPWWNEVAQKVEARSRRAMAR